MALFNYATKEITLKIVYYGPGLSGKTTNIQHLHSVLNPENKGKLLSLATESDRTLFFDFLPIELGKIKEFSIRFQLYTVPGQVRYNATRKVVLKGADAVVFVADSQRDMQGQNIESLENMMENLISNNINPDEIPIVLQYNKRDLKNILTVDELNTDINENNAHVFVEAEAINGKGVEDTFQLVTRLVLKDIARKHKIEIQPVSKKEDEKNEEIIADIQMPEPEPSNPDSEIEILEPSSYSLEDEFEILGPEPVLTEELKEASVVQKFEPEPKLFKPDTEDEVVQPSSYSLEDEFEILGAEPIVKEELKETSVVQKSEPEPAPRIKAEYTFEKETYEKTAKDIKEVKEPSIASPDQIRMIADDVAKLNSMLVELKVTVSSLKADIIEIKAGLSTLKENAVPREDKNLKEIRKEQREIRSILRDITAAFGELKTKKRWFRF